MSETYLLAALMTLMLWVFAFAMIYFAVFLPRSRSYTAQSYALFCRAALSCSVGAILVALFQPLNAQVHAELAPFDGGTAIMRYAVAAAGAAVGIYAYVRRRALSAD